MPKDKMTTLQGDTPSYSSKHLCQVKSAFKSRHDQVTAWPSRIVASWLSSVTLTTELSTQSMHATQCLIKGNSCVKKLPPTKAKFQPEQEELKSTIHKATNLINVQKTPSDWGKHSIILYQIILKSLKTRPSHSPDKQNCSQLNSTCDLDF